MSQDYYILKTLNMKDENICYFQTDYIDIESDDNIEWAIDGECGGYNNKVKIYNINKFIDFIVPKED